MTVLSARGLLKSLMLTSVLLLLTVRASDARRLGLVRPIHVRVTTYVGAQPAGSRPDFDWVVAYGGKRYELQVLNLVVLDGAVLPLDIDAAVRPYRVKFQLAGDKTALQRFAATPPNQQIVILGYLRIDASGRWFMLDTVDPGVTPTPSVAAAP